MWSSPFQPSLPTQVTATVGARLTLPASSSEEAIRGSGLQVRILRAPSLTLLRDLVSRELRAHAMSHLGDGKSAKRKSNAALSAVAAHVIAALEAGDFRAAVVTHGTGFGLGVELPPQLGGGVGECLVLPERGGRRKVTIADDVAEGDGAEGSDDDVSIAA